MEQKLTKTTCVSSEQEDAVLELGVKNDAVKFSGNNTTIMLSDHP